MNDADKAVAPEASGRIPVLFLLWKAAGWLALGLLLCLLNSFRYHSPDFLSGWSWLTFGRIEALANLSLAYGFALPAAWAAALLLLSRSGGAPVARPAWVFLGAVLWQVGLVAAAAGILAGDVLPYRWFELPSYAAWILLAAYLPVGASALATLWQRRQSALEPAHWFLMAALLWFPWILSAAAMVLHGGGARGTAQIPVAQWYSSGLLNVALGGIVLGAAVHLLPQRLGAPLPSRQACRFAFWLWVAFAGSARVLPGAPVPAWISALGAASSFFVALALLALAWNFGQALAAAGRERALEALWRDRAHRFVAVGALAFLLHAALQTLNPLLARHIQFTLVQPGMEALWLSGSVAMVLFGATYLLAPRALGGEPLPARAMGLHFWLAFLGTLLLVLTRFRGGEIQGGLMGDPAVPHGSAYQITLFYLRQEILGLLLLLASGLLYMRNLGGLACRTLCCGPGGWVTRAAAVVMDRNGR